MVDINNGTRLTLVDCSVARQWYYNKLNNLTIEGIGMFLLACANMYIMAHHYRQAFAWTWLMATRQMAMTFRFGHV